MLTFCTRHHTTMQMDVNTVQCVKSKFIFCTVLGITFADPAVKFVVWVVCYLMFLTNPVYTVDSAHTVWILSIHCALRNMQVCCRAGCGQCHLTPRCRSAGQTWAKHRARTPTTSTSLTDSDQPRSQSPPQDGSSLSLHLEGDTCHGDGRVKHRLCPAFVGGQVLRPHPPLPEEEEGGFP